MRLKNYGSAVSLADKALNINPKYMKAHFRKVKCLMLLKKYKESVNSCKVALKVENDKLFRKMMKESKEELEKITLKAQNENLIKINKL